MNKLKTLNDLKVSCLLRNPTTQIIELKEDKHIEGDEENTWVNFKQLKQEAIKWDKSFKSGECWTDFAADGRNGQENIEEWIEHFFNITEGDLNNE